MRKNKLIALITLAVMLTASVSLSACIVESHVHKYEYTVIKVATCESEGLTYGLCSCGESIEKVIPAPGHNFVGGSCISGKICANCGEEDTETLGHTEVVDKAVDPTCTETGLTEGKHCSVCETVLVKQEVVDVLGHTEVVDKAVDPTCTETGLTEGKHCSVCDTVLVKQEVVDALGHTEVVDRAVAPTCTESGLTEGKHCSVCETVLVKQEVVDALGHTEVVDSAVDPTCTETGLTEGKHCSVCETVLVKQEVVGALGHTEVVDRAVDPTCTETGLTEGKHCSVCNTVLVAQEVVDALGHTEVVDSAVAPTCTESGLTEGKHCSVCETVLVAQQVVDALGHTEVVDRAVDPTCTETGLTEGKHCSVCDTVLVAQQVVDALGHKVYETIKTEVTVQNYITTNASTYPFSVSGNQITSTNKASNSSSTYTITAKRAFSLELQYKVSSESNYDWLIINHNTTQKVKVSGYSQTTFTAITIAMQAGDTVTIKYTKDGSVDKGDNCAYVKIITPATETATNETTQLVSATEEKIASMISCSNAVVCEVCSAVLAEQLEHSYIAHEAQAVTCVQIGWNAYNTCANCDYTEYEEIPALGHDLDEQRICKTCGEEIVSQGLSFTLNSDNESYTVSGIGTCRDEDLIIPSYYNGKPVTAVAERAFVGLNFLKTVTISGNVKVIGNYAFQECNSIVTVIIGNSVTTIENNAFMLCSSLVRVEIGNSVKSIYSQAFRGCRSLLEIVVSEDNEYFVSDNNVLYNKSKTVLVQYPIAKSDTSFVIPSTVKTISPYVFYLNNTLKTVIIPISVTSIGNSAFYSCSSVYIYCEAESEPEGWSWLWNESNRPVVWGFDQSNPSLEYALNEDGETYSVTGFGHNIESNLVIPATYNNKPVTAIAANAFNCEMSLLLNTIVISEGITSIGNNAFENCSNLISVIIPNSVQSIGVGAFKGCNGLQEITLPFIGASSSAIGYKSVFGYIFGYICYGGEASPSGAILQYNDAYGELYYYYYVPNSIRKVTVNSNIIPACAFYNCSNLTNIILPNEVESLGFNAFYGCTSLEYTIEGGLKYWGTTSNPYLYLAGVSSKSITSANINQNCRFIGSSAFEDCSSLTSVVIPNTVTVIPSYAFYNCYNLKDIYYGGTVETWFNINGVDNLTCYGSSFKNLYFNNQLVTEVVIPNTVTVIPSYAFYKCSSLTSVVISDSVTSIGYFAFYGCRSLTSVVIGDGVTSISQSAFSNCSSLTSVVIGESVTSIDNNAFSNCSSLTNLTAPGFAISYVPKSNLKTVSITSGIIYSSAFSGCKLLTSVVIGESVTSIGNYAFYNCSSLTSVVIGNGVTSIGYDAFRGCSSLTSVVIPEGVTSIGDEAFFGCGSLTSVVIPNSVTSIGKDVFKDCSSLECTIEGGLKYLGNSNNPYIYLIGFSSNSITSANINQNCKFIGYSVFRYCTSLTSVVIPNSVISIGEDAFYYCSSLTLIEIPDSVTSIGEDAFYNCYNLTSVVIGESVTEIGSYAFRNCYNLKDIYYGGTVETWLNISGLYNLMDCGSSFKNLYFNNQLVTEVVIPNTVTVIPPYAFSDCSSLTSVVIPNSVTEIGYSAFYNCSSLTSVVIPESVTEIGSYAFSGCSSLTSVVIPNSVTSIGERAFAYCSSLTVYCEATTRPSGWNSYWNYSNRPVYWYSEYQPTSSGNYWHYDENGIPTEW